jgi:membrane-associated phospholipid phosphatase
MQKPGSIFLENRIFFTGYILFLAISLFFLLIYAKVPGFFLLNGYHSGPLDMFFLIYTNVGDGLFSIGIFLFLLWLRKPSPGWEIVFAFLLSGLAVQILKNAFPMPRPRTLIGDEHYNYFIKEVTHVGYASFPSGHTATAFGTAALLSIFTKKKTYTLLFLTAALLVAYSRIYLGQHFLQDVFAGALIGVPSALVVYSVFKAHPRLIDKLTREKRKLK